MVAYSDVPAINVLYQEQEQVSNAITMIDEGGRVMNFTVGPAPYNAGQPAPMPMMMSVVIMTPNPSAELMVEARAALITRQGEIVAELTALGVTESPAAMSARAVKGDRDD